MLTLAIPIWLLLAHWIADFVFQSDWMALNKSKSWDALLIHTYIYTCIMIVFLASTIPDSYFLLSFGLITFFTHTTQDYFTSRLNAYLWQKDMRHWFFVSVGFDQLLHYVTLALTLKFII